MNSNENTSSFSGIVRFASTPPATGLPPWYPTLLDSISTRISRGQQRAQLAINLELISTYWHIGRDILERQSEQDRGSKVIDRLAADLKDRNPDINGFSSRNLMDMCSFAEAWSSEAIVQEPVAQLPWGHNEVLLDKLDDESNRLWHALIAISEGWSRNHMVHQIEARLHEPTSQAVSNFNAVLPTSTSAIVQDAMQDPYVFDFMELTEAHNERELEAQLLQHVERFLLEVGRGFAFVGRQLRLYIAGDEFFPDLVFYNFVLRRFVVVELKVTKFEPGFLGQLGMYMSAVDDCSPSPGMSQQSVRCCAGPRTRWWPNMRYTASAPPSAWPNGPPKSKNLFQKIFPAACRVLMSWKQNLPVPKLLLPTILRSEIKDLAR